MFLDEARIAGQIDHENVARTLEIGEDRDVLYHAMELVDGESVRKLYRDVRSAGAAFPLGVALRIAADTLSGLHAVHELVGADGRKLEVVHRDVSPQNILVTVRGTVKLIDFGVAKMRERRTEETTAGTLKGKIEYMAPEQANGTQADRRADVYAVGAVLYELLAGEALRNTDDGRQLLALHELMTGAPYEPLHPGVPLPVRTIVDRSLANDPEDRYRTAEDMRRAIEQAMASMGLVATSEDVASALSQYSRERTQRRKDAIDAAVRVAQALEKERGPIPNPASSRASMASRASMPSRSHSIHSSEETYVSMSGSAPGTDPGHAPDFMQEPGGTLVQPLVQYPMSSADMLEQHSIDDLHEHHMLMPVLPAIVNADGSNTGPSMRTMQGASLSAAPPPSKSGFGTVIVLGFVGVLGVVAGVLVARQPPRVAADTPASPITYVAASATVPTPSAPVILPLPPALPSSSSARPAGRGTVSTGGVAKPPPPPPPPPAGDGTKPVKPVKPKKPKGDGDEYGF